MTTFRNLENLDNDYFEFQFRRIKIDPGIEADWMFGSMSGMNNALNELSKQDLSIGCTIEGSTVKCTPEGQVVIPELQLLIDSEYIGISKDLTLQRELEKEALQEQITNLEAQLSLAQETDKERIARQISALQGQIKDIEVEITPVISLPTKGMPQVNSFITDDIFANEIGTLRVLVSNTGTEQDSFDIDLSCSKDISFGSKRITLAPNEDKTIELKYNGDAGDYDCQINAVSVNNPSNKDSKLLNIFIKEKPLPQTIEDYRIEVREQKDSNFLLWTIIILLIGIIGFGTYNARRKRK